MDKTRKRRLIPFQNWSKLLGRWLKFESENKEGQWAQKQHLHLNILKFQNYSTIHNKYVVVPADKAPDNIVLICNKNYIDFLIN